MKTTSTRIAKKVSAALSIVQSYLLTLSFGAQVPFKFGSARVADRHPELRDEILSIWGVTDTTSIIKKDNSLNVNDLAQRNIAVAKLMKDNERAKYDWITAASSHNQINPAMKQQLDLYIAEKWPTPPAIERTTTLLNEPAPAGF
jgi:hypothetical protein